MKANQNKEIRDKQFLFSKTDLTLTSHRTELLEHVPESELKIEFPDILFGKRFLDQAMEHLKHHSIFGVLAIRIDDLKSDHNKASTSIQSIRMDLANAINRICEKEDGIWGFVDSDIFGCFFPDKNGAESQTLAKKIKQLFSVNGHTATIGVAFFPTLDYERESIIDNAIKAVDHAEFFGDDSMVEFDAVSLNISGDKYYDSGDINQAIIEFKTALLLEPSNVNVHNSIGVCYGIQGKYDSALDAFNTVLELDANEIMSLYNIGLVKAMTGCHEEALNYFLKAEKKDNTLFEVIYQTGRLHLEQNELDKALEYFNRAIELKSDSAIVYANLGECHTALKNTQKAISAYKNAIKLNPNDAASLSALGLLYSQRGENTEIATLFCRQSVDLAPENSLFRYNLGNLYYKENRLKKALSQFEKAAALGYNCEKEIQQVHHSLES